MARKKPKRGARPPPPKSKKPKPKVRIAKSYALKAPLRVASKSAKSAQAAPAAPVPATVMAEAPVSRSVVPPLEPPLAATPALFIPQPETLHGWLEEAERRLADAGIEAARRDAQLLVAAVLGGRSADLRFAEDHPIGSREGQRIENFLRRRVKTREPVSRILGRREFWSLDFRVTPAVLDPRPDSETLVEVALSAFSDVDAAFAVADLGTGSGCLLLSVLHERPNAVGLGVDLSEQALAVAQGNAERLGLAERVAFRKSDWAAAISEAFDLVLCNPPYIAEADREALAPEVARHDPRGALFAGPDGLDAYRAILPELPRLLAPGGVALFEIGATQAEAVSAIACAAGLAVVDVVQDLAGRDRCVILAMD